MSAARTNRSLRLVLAGLAVLAPLGVDPTPFSRAVPTDAVVSIHQARLRKLHLVRPDLINYPISFDALC